MTVEELGIAMAAWLRGMQKGISKQYV